MTPDCEIARKQLVSELSQEDSLEHLEGCSDCQTWLDAELIQGDGAEITDSPERIEILEASLQRETGLVSKIRSFPTALRVRLWALVVLLVVGVQLILTPRPDLAVYPLARLALEVAVHGVVVGAIGAFLLRPVYKISWPSSFVPALALLALLLPIGIALTSPAHTAHAESLRGVGADYWPRAMQCLRYGAMMGAPILILAAVSERSGEMSLTKLLGLLGAGMALGSLALTLHCPIVAPSHLLLGHVAVALPLLLVAVLALRATRNRSPRKPPLPGRVGSS